VELSSFAAGGGPALVLQLQLLVLLFVIPQGSAFAVVVARSPPPTSTLRHPERSAAESKDPDAHDPTKTARTISTNDVFAVACSPHVPKKHRHLDQRQRTLPP
jgi:hypothetical protein